MADFLLAAALAWMTPLLAALSSAREACLSRVPAASLSPAAAASRNLRIEVFSDDFTALLRRRAFSLVLLRLICDLMFATEELASVCLGIHRNAGAQQRAPSA